MSHPILADAQAKMKKAVDYTLHEFSSIHTGKASPAMVEGVMVDAYGSMTPLKGCAAIRSRHPRRRNSPRTNRSASRKTFKPPPTPPSKASAIISRTRKRIC